MKPWKLSTAAPPDRWNKADSALQLAIATRRSLQGKDKIDSGAAVISLAMVPNRNQARFAEAEQLARGEIELAKK